jgi:hypothetical protein
VIFAFLTPSDRISHPEFVEPGLRFGLGVFQEPVEALTDFDFEYGTTARDNLPLMVADLPRSAVFS